VTLAAAGERRRGLLSPEWALIAFLWVAYVLNHADRQVVYTLFPALQKTFGYSDTVLGLTGALFLWIYGAFSPIAGILGDRWSRPKIVVGSLTMWSIFTILSGFAPNGTALLICRGLLGISESFFMPAAFVLMANAHGPESRSRAVAFFGTSQMAGVAIGGSLSGLIAQNWNWRVSFWLLGTLGLLFAFPLWRFLSSVPPHFKGSSTAPRATLSSFGALFRIPSLRVVTVYVSVATFGLYLVYTWLPTFLYDKFSLSLAKAGFESSVYPQIGTLAGLVIGGMAADKLYRTVHAARFWIVLAAFVVGGPCIYLIGSSVTLEATRMAAVCFGACAGFMFANQAPSAFDVVPPTQRASAVGILNFVGASISGFAPFLGGMARKTIGVGQLMAYTSVIYMATAALVLYVILRHFEKDHRRSQEV
jgi:predicted MFS family arabinose efflux permease